MSAADAILTVNSEYNYSAPESSSMPLTGYRAPMATADGMQNRLASWVPQSRGTGRP